MLAEGAWTQAKELENSWLQTSEAYSVLLPQTLQKPVTDKTKSNLKAGNNLNSNCWKQDIIYWIN